MKIPKKDALDRKSKINALFFMKNLKQKEIAKFLGISERTVRRYVQKSK